MDDKTQQALQIAKEFQFSEFKLQATTNGNGDAPGGEFASCENHLDADFMKLLAEGAHLDIKRFPL